MEPPILMSRILAFVLAASVVVLGSLVFTLLKMMPLERPEVFFLLTQTRPSNVVIEPLVPDTNNKVATSNYIHGFIREYITARNTLYTNSYITKNNWTKVVKPWSSNEIYDDFVHTDLYKAYALSSQTPGISCSVNFPDSKKNSSIVDLGDDKFLVNFMWLCENIGGQTTQKNYKIEIRIQSDLDKKMSGVFENLEKLSANPLGIQVTQYTILDGKGDPLNSDVKSW